MDLVLFGFDFGPILGALFNLRFWLFLLPFLLLSYGLYRGLLLLRRYLMLSSYERKLRQKHPLSGIAFNDTEKTWYPVDASPLQYLSNLIARGFWVAISGFFVMWGLLHLTTLGINLI